MTTLRLKALVCMSWRTEERRLSYKLQEQVEVFMHEEFEILAIVFKRTPRQVNMHIWAGTCKWMRIRRMTEVTPTNGNSSWYWLLDYIKQAPSAWEWRDARVLSLKMMLSYLQYLPNTAKCYIDPSLFPFYYYESQLIKRGAIKTGLKTFV